MRNIFKFTRSKNFHFHLADWSTDLPHLHVLGARGVDVGQDFKVFTTVKTLPELIYYIHTYTTHNQQEHHQHKPGAEWHATRQHLISSRREHTYCSAGIWSNVVFGASVFSGPHHHQDFIAHHHAKIKLPTYLTHQRTDEANLDLFFSPVELQVDGVVVRV